MAGRDRDRDRAPGLWLNRSQGATAANVPLGAEQGRKMEEMEGWAWSQRGAPGRPPHPQLPEPAHGDTLRASVSLPTNKARKPRPLGLVRTWGRHPAALVPECWGTPHPPHPCQPQLPLWPPCPLLPSASSLRPISRVPSPTRTPHCAAQLWAHLGHGNWDPDGRRSPGHIRPSIVRSPTVAGAVHPGQVHRPPRRLPTWDPQLGSNAGRGGGAAAVTRWQSSF